MEPAIAGALYTAESPLEGAVAFAQVITHPTLPSALPSRTSPPLLSLAPATPSPSSKATPTSSAASPHPAHSPTMTCTRPSSGVLEADYQSLTAQPTEPNGSTPASRKGHSAVVIGNSIYISGGEGVADEKGRAWVFDTVAKTWSHLDPAPGAPYPSHRALHAAASSELPGLRRRCPSCRRAIRGGRCLCVGGRAVEGGKMLEDGLAFDVRTRAWLNIPTPPGHRWLGQNGCCGE